MKKETYNGWTNYATWRINLEIFDAYQREEGEEVNARYLEELCDEIVTEGAPDLCASYARAFLARVNFYEIAENINSNNNE